MNPAANLILIGPMGSGKTSTGRRLAQLLQMPFVDLDQAIEQRTGASIALTFEIEGEDGFRRRESELLAEHVGRRGIVLSTGGGAILSEANRSLMRDNGFVVWLDAGVDAQLMRLRHDRKRPLLDVPDRHAKLVELATHRNPLYAAAADLRVESSGLGSSSALTRHLATLLDSAWQRPALEALP